MPLRQTIESHLNNVPDFRAHQIDIRGLGCILDRLSSTLNTEKLIKPNDFASGTLDRYPQVVVCSAAALPMRLQEIGIATIIGAT